MTYRYVFHDKFDCRIHLPRINLGFLYRSAYLSTLHVRILPVIKHYTQFASVLAVQNINSSGVVTKDHEIEFNALSGSLNMMRNGGCRYYCKRSRLTGASAVLNDVLDLLVVILTARFCSFIVFSNRMDSGTFEVSSRVCEHE